jgi:hypothetical protein
MSTDNDAREILAKHQRRATGMTGNSPDTCACGERIFPAPTKGWDDYSDIMDRRDEALAAHQASVLAEQGYSKPREADTDAVADLSGVIRQHALMTHIFGKVNADELAEVILAAGYSKQHPPTVTDEMVEAAAEAMCIANEDGPWEYLLDNLQDDYRRAARLVLAAALGAVRPAPEPEWEYGWRSFFNGTAEEYEWLDCGSREEAERQIALFQETEDRTRALRGHDSGRLTYSLWRRRVTQPGPWEPVPEPTEGETR